MFGYLVADRKNLSEEEFQQYKAAYCGICSCLRKNGTISGSIALSYDLVFLWLILSSMYEPEEKQISEKCPVHPFKGTPLLLNNFSDYAADVGIMLAYYKAEDDWNDDRNLAKRAAAGILQNRFEAVSRKLPRQSIAIKEQIGRISALEESKSGDIDALCNSFGKLLGELFVYSENEHWARYLREFGEAVGRYLYLLDAVVDLKEDVAKNRYNPLCQAEKISREWQEEAVEMYLGEISQTYEYLPVVKYSPIINSIVYSGMTEKLDIIRNKGDIINNEP